MSWSPFFWALGGVCNTLRQLGMVFLSWKEVGCDGWHPFKFCYPPLGALFQTRYPVGSNQTGSSFLPHCQRKLSKSFHSSPDFADKDKKDKLLDSLKYRTWYSFRPARAVEFEVLEVLEVLKRFFSKFEKGVRTSISTLSLLFWITTPLNSRLNFTIRTSISSLFRTPARELMTSQY